MSLYDLLIAQSNKTPDAIAIVSPGRLPLTFARLCAQVGNVVSTLHSIGIGRTDRVAVVLSDGPEAAVAFLGVASGATCAPLDPRYRPNEFEACLLDLGAKAVIVSAGSGSPVIDLARKHGIALLELAPVLKEEAGIFSLSGTQRRLDFRDGSAQTDDLALVLHTSGTTGRSKLVPLTHANISATTQRVQAALDLSCRDRYLNVTPLLYSQGVMLTFSSILSGASVVCPLGFSTAHFFDWMEEFRPTWYSAAPAVHQSILAQSRTKHDLANRHRFRLIRSAAAPLPFQVREQLEGVFRSPVIDAYGMTECYPISSSPLPPAKQKPGSVGLAAGTEIAVMNEAGAFLPVGATGELVVRGPHVMTGYLNEPSGDSRSFSQGWFRTGDQGHLDSDGYVFLTGRTKDIINRGGEKINPGEVDVVLLDHPDVAEAVTFALPHLTLGEDIAAAVVLREHASVTERDIQAFASERLVPFKVPRHVVFLNELPKSVTGKVQRHALAEKFGFAARRQVSDPGTTPHRGASSDVERRLLEIWIQLLGIGIIGMQDNFFDLGGHSLLAIQLITQIEQVFGKCLPLPALVQAPTIEQLAKVISQETWTTVWSTLVPIQPYGSRPPFFWVHGDASTRFLATYLGRDQPLYGLEHQSQDGTPARYTTVETIAGHYLDGVRSIQSAGPYFVGGFSFGGTVAFEMAQQLRRKGERVGILVLLDSRFPGGHVADSVGSETVSSFSADVRNQLHRVADLQPRERLAYVMVGLRNRLRGPTTQVTKRFKTACCKVLLRMGRPIPASLLSHYLVGIYQKARSAYEPHPYSGRVIYIKSEKRSSYHRTRWSGVIGDGLEWHEVPGDHLDVITQPYAHSWAEKLKDWLDAAQKNPSRSS